MDPQTLPPNTVEMRPDNTEISQSEIQQTDDVHTLARRLSRSPEPVIVSKRRRNLFVIFLFLLLIVAGYLVWQAYRPIPVEITVVSYQRAGAASQPVLRQSGYVTYPRKVTVGSSATGILNRIYFEEGDVVKQGDLLAAFDVQSLQAQQALSEAAVLDAQQTLTRMQNLHNAGAASAVDLQQAETGLRTARAQVDLIRAQVASSYIRAPFGGRILEQLADVGERAPAGICVLVDDSKTLIEFEINQEDLPLLSEEQPALVVLDALPQTEYAGRLFRMSPMANKTTNTIRAEVMLLQPDAHILPNMSARVYLVKEAQAQNGQVLSVLSVDRSALYEENATSYVWLIQNDRVTARRIKTGASLGVDEVEIIEGLKADDIVIKQPSNYSLQEGARVNLVQ